jgi:hypothetical protein
VSARAYLGLAAGAALAALALSFVARVPRPAAAPPQAAPAAPVVEITLELGADGVAPEVAQVPKDHRVELVVVNRRPAPASFALAGYEDRVGAGAIAPGATWRASFVADRPGEGFAWLVGGEPAGRLAVTGSHLEEGHR